MSDTISKEMFENYKKEQQNKFRRFVVFVIVFCIILSGLTGVASYSLAAGDTSFTPHDVTWNVENVEAALNNLNLRTNQLATNYSTEEQVVGRWIDGKKMYQKTIIINNPAHGSSWVNVSFSSIDIHNVEHVYYMEGILYGGPNDPGDYNIYSYRPTMTLGIIVTAQPEEEKLMYMNNWVSSSANGGVLYITMRYTKKSD